MRVVPSRVQEGSDGAGAAKLRDRPGVEAELAEHLVGVGPEERWP